MIVRGLLRRHTWSRAKALRFTNAEHADWVDSVTGEAIAKALPKYNPERGPFFYWAFLEARSQASDELDKEQRRLSATDRFEIAAEVCAPPPRDDFGDYLLRDELYGLLEQLTPDQRDALCLYYLAELPVKEVALIMNRRTNAVDALIFRALRKARLLYAKQNNLKLSTAALNAKPNGRKTVRPRDSLDSDPDDPDSSSRVTKLDSRRRP